jgi:hypothetical protein
MPAGWVAGAGSILGGILGAGASESAASQQAAAAENAQNISEREFNTITGQESPFMESGYGSLGQLNYLLGNGQPGTAAAPGVGGGSTGVAPTASSSSAGGYGSLLQPFNTSDWQQLSPAYNFQKQQGAQGVLNSDAAGAGALSGSAQKDLINYNQGLANTSFNNAFGQYTTQQNNIFSRLSGIAQLGQTAASNTGLQGTALAGQAGQAAVAAGSYGAAGTVGAANNISGGLSGALPWLSSGGGAPSYTTNGAITGGGGNTMSAGDGYTFSY